MILPHEDPVRTRALIQLVDIARSRFVLSLYAGGTKQLWDTYKPVFEELRWEYILHIALDDFIRQFFTSLFNTEPIRDRLRYTNIARNCIRAHYLDIVNENKPCVWSFGYPFAKLFTISTSTLPTLFHTVEMPDDYIKLLHNGIGEPHKFVEYFISECLILESLIHQYHNVYVSSKDIEDIFLIETPDLKGRRAVKYETIH